MAMAKFNLDILECMVCYDVPTKNSLMLCKNQHVICGTCYNKLGKSKCPTCRKDFTLQKNILVEKILDSIEMDCKYKDQGCDCKITMKNREEHETECVFRTNCKYEKDGCREILNPGEWKEHENDCRFRKIFCFFRSCQRNETKVSVHEILRHIEENHSQYVPIKRIDITDEFCQFEIDYKELYGLIYERNQLRFIFGTHYAVNDGTHLGFWINDYKSVRKACLISVLPKDQAKQMNCSISLTFDGAESGVFHYNGKIYSHEDFENLRNWKSGGLVYPAVFCDYHESSSSMPKFKIQIFDHD